MAGLSPSAVVPRGHSGASASQGERKAKAFWREVAFQSRLERPAEATVWGYGLVNAQKGKREAARGFPQPSGFWFGRHRAGERCLRKARGWAKLEAGRAEASSFPMLWQVQEDGRRAEGRLSAGQRRVHPAGGWAARLSGRSAGTGGAKRPRQQGGVAPNRACSGRGYAPGRPARQKFGKILAVGDVGRHAPPLTPSLASELGPEEHHMTI